jgi:hypothetical protein
MLPPHKKTIEVCVKKSAKMRMDAAKMHVHAKI